MPPPEEKTVTRATFWHIQVVVEAISMLLVWRAEGETALRALHLARPKVKLAVASQVALLGTGGWVPAVVVEHKKTPSWRTNSRLGVLLN